LITLYLKTPLQSGVFCFNEEFNQKLASTGGKVSVVPLWHPSTGGTVTKDLESLPPPEGRFRWFPFGIPPPEGRSPTAWKACLHRREGNQRLGKLASTGGKVCCWVNKVRGAGLGTDGSQPN